MFTPYNVNPYNVNPYLPQNNYNNFQNPLHNNYSQTTQLQNDGFTPLINGISVKFSQTEDIFYMKQIDEFGNKIQKKFAFHEIVETPANGNFVTKDEFNILQTKIDMLISKAGNSKEVINNAE